MDSSIDVPTDGMSEYLSTYFENSNIWYAS